MQLKMEIRDKRRGAEEAGRRKGQREGVAIWSHHLVRALKRLKAALRQQGCVPALKFAAFQLHRSG